MPRVDDPGPNPADVREPQDVARELDRLRRRAARGSGRARVSLDAIAKATGIPRSTIHSYVSGRRLPPPDVLDAIVVALGGTRAEQVDWAHALERAVDAAPRVDRAGSARPVAAPHQLPAGPVGFVGREQELGRLAAKAARTGEGSAAPAVVAVTGIGGVGKTALVLHWAHRSRDAFPDGELWVDLRGYSAAAPLDASDALERLLRAVGVGTAQLSRDVDARAAMFRSAVAGRRMLLVVDNARDSEHVRPLLPGTPGFVTVVTSRDALRSLVAREGAVRLKVEPLEMSAAVELLGDGLPAAVAQEVSPERIAARCDGLPLALRIVRERLSSAHAGDVRRFAEELEGGFQDRLAVLDVNDSAAELSIRTAMEWSYRSLPADAAGLLRRLPLCLVPTFDVDTVRVLLDTAAAPARRLLEVLVAANLLDVAGPDQFRIHDLVADYAADRLAAEEEPDAVADARTRLLEYLISTVEGVLAICDPSRPVRLARPEPQRPDLRPQVEPFPDAAAAREWTTGHTDMLVAAGLDAAARGRLDHAAVLVEWTWRALWLLANVGVMESALHAISQAARRARAVRPQWMARRLLAITYAQSAQMADAERAFEDAIALAEGAGDDEAVRLDTANLAFVRALTGDLARATEALEAVVAEFPEGGVHELPPLLSLVELELERGDLEAAGRWVGRALASPAVAGRQGSIYLEAQVLAARLTLDAGDLEGARARFDVLERECRSAGTVETLCVVLERLAVVHHRLGDLPAAEALARQAIAATQEMGSRSKEVVAAGTLGNILRDAGRPEEALEVIEPAIEGARRARIKFAECRNLIFAAHARWELGDDRSATADAETALEIAERCGYLALQAEAGELVEKLGGGESR